MKKYRLYFVNQIFDFSKNNETDIAEFDDINELERNYLKYFEGDYQKSEWEIFNFDERMQKDDSDEGIILAVNKFAFQIEQYRSMENTENNPILNLFKAAPKLPVLLCVRYI